MLAGIRLNVSQGANQGGWWTVHVYGPETEHVFTCHAGTAVGAARKALDQYESLDRPVVSMGVYDESRAARSPAVGDMLPRSLRGA